MGINTDAVQRLYVAYFNRPADPAGLVYWEGGLPSTTVATQAELTAIARGFSGSIEYAALYSGQTNAQVVNSLYVNLFGRPAEAAGLAHWSARIADGSDTFASIALQLTYSAQGSDATAIANKLTAATAFTNALDTTTEIASYFGLAAAAVARTWLATATVNGTTNTPAQVAAALDAALATLNTAVSDMIPAGSGSGGGGGGDSTPPTLSSSSPADNAADVAVGSNIVLTFNETIVLGAGNIVLKATSDNSTIETFDVAAGSGDAGGTVTANGTAVTINPNADLSLGTGYYVTVADTAVRDAAGNPYAGITSTTALNFATVAGGDSTPPTLSSSTPADGAGSVAVGSNIVLTFSENVVAGAGSILIKKASDNSTVATIAVGDAQVTFNGTTGVTINPTADLAAGTAYYVTMASGVIADAAGNPYAGISLATDLNFTTASPVYTLTSSAPIITEIMVGGAITKAMTFTLTLGSVPTEAVTVNYETLTSGTAASGTDFEADTGTVTFVAGQTVANVSVVVNNDATAEGDETVAVQFSGASLAAPVTGTGTILKNDTAGFTVVLTAGTETPVLGPDDDTINSTQAVPVQLGADDIVAGGDGTDVLTITPTVDTAFTLDDAIFTQVSGIDKIVIADTGTGGQTITTAGLFQAAFGTAGVDLQTTATTAATGAGMVVDLSAVTGPLTLTTTTTTGAQTITTGNGNATVFATASTGPVGITTGTGADVVTLTTSADTIGVGCVINTGAGNDIITIVAAGAAALTIPNLITGGLGADTITLSNDAEWNNIVIGDADSGITLAGADSINGFVAATDTLKMGTAASVTGAPTTDNYVEAIAAVADFAAALAAANTQLAALALATTGALEAYAFQWDATNGYLFNDTDGSGTADQVVVLVGIIGTTISDVDIIA